MTKLAQLKAKRDSLNAEMLAASKEAFNETAKSLFEKYLKLESFSWRQYTPYFNDGDECTFSAHTDSFDLVWGGKELEDVDEYTFISTYTDEEIKKDVELKSFTKDIQAMFENLDDDMLKEMFGDHVKITAKKDEVQIDEYSHD